MNIPRFSRTELGDPRDGWSVELNDERHDIDYGRCISRAREYNVFFDIDEVIKIVQRCADIKSHKYDRFVFDKEDIEKLIDTIRTDKKGHTFINGLHHFSLIVIKKKFVMQWK